MNPFIKSLYASEMRKCQRLRYRASHTPRAKESTGSNNIRQDRHARYQTEVRMFTGKSADRLYRPDGLR